MNGTYLLLRDQVTFQVLGGENSSMHSKQLSLIRNNSHYSTIARGFIRIPLPKAVKISAPDASAIYLISLDLNYNIYVSFTENESYAGIWLVGSAKITSLRLSIWSFLLNCGVIPRPQTIYLHLHQLRRLSRRPMTVLRDDVH